MAKIVKAQHRCGAANEIRRDHVCDVLRHLQGPVVLSRDHHDVSGTDSPFRETSNIRDGSRLCADMAVHNVIGDSVRGATWVALHNGGGVGWLVIQAHAFCSQVRWYFQCRPTSIDYSRG